MLKLVRDLSWRRMLEPAGRGWRWGARVCGTLSVLFLIGLLLSIMFWDGEFAWDWALASALFSAATIGAWFPGMLLGMCREPHIHALFGGAFLLAMIGATLFPFVGAGLTEMFVVLTILGCSAGSLIQVGRLIRNGVNGSELQRATDSIRPFPIAMLGFVWFSSLLDVAPTDGLDASVSGYIGVLLSGAWFVALVGPSMGEVAVALHSTSD